MNLRVERSGPHARVVLDRPDVRNAFDAGLIAALHDAFTALDADSTVRTIVLAGEGAVFCGGADVGWMRASLDLGHEENVRDARTMAAMFAAIDACGKPVIGRLHGAALGGGAGLAAVCDIVVAATATVFGFTETKLGIIPAVISPFVLAKIGVSAARALFVTGERFDAVRAERIGLVHHIAEANELDARIAAIEAECLSAGPQAIAAAKRLIAAVRETPAADAAAFTAHAIATQRTSPEGQEGLRAFLERRRPAWTIASSAVS